MVGAFGCSFDRAVKLVILILVEVLGVDWALRWALFDSFVEIVLFDSFLLGSCCFVRRMG